jgi:DNA adenine methylase
MTAKAVLPFLKWPGGKRWLSRDLAELIRPLLRGTYFEPFLGGAAVFFELQPQRAVLSDINADLVDVYRHVKADPSRVLREVRKLRVNKQTYERVRRHKSNDPVKRAADFLYLNRTAWGGIYRLNADGKFNVPFGGGERTPSPLWKRHLVVDAAEALDKAEVIQSDFEPVLESCGFGDVAYCDPTYTVTHDRNCFIRYNEKNFTWQDQVRLSEACLRAAKRGASVFVSNAHHPRVKELYRCARVVVLRRKSLVSAVVTKRSSVQEYLFCIEPSG